MKKSILKKYSNKPVNPAYYDTIKITGEKEPIGLMEGIRQREANKPPVSVEEELQRLNVVSRKLKNIILYGGFEFMKKLKTILPKKYF
jgi:disulfide oxidoreductase YuzD